MKKNKSIEFKGTVATLSALTVTLRSNELADLEKGLRELCGDTPDFFNEDIALLDVAALPEQGRNLDWPALVTLLRSVRLNPVLVRHAASEAEEAIREAGLTRAEDIEVTTRKPAAVLADVEGVTKPAVSCVDAPKTNVQPELGLTPAVESQQVKASVQVAAALPSSPTYAPAMVIDRPLRSGQQIYAKNADLVVLAMVNPGAEVMADGNIHVYAPLRGRALAGASGNVNARIMTTCFEAELVSIGGVYRPLDPGMPKEVSGKPAQVRLVDDGNPDKQTLLIESLKIG